MAKQTFNFNTATAAQFVGGIEEKEKKTKRKPRVKANGEPMTKIEKPDFLKGTHYTIEETMEKMGLCYNTLKKLIDGGEISRVRYGRPYYVPIKDVEAYLKKVFKK